MAARDVKDRVRERLERKVERVTQKLEELHGDEELQQALNDVATELDQVDAELDALLEDVTSEVVPGLQERLDARRERLLAKQERIQLKLELRNEMRQRLEESLEEMQLRLQETLMDMRETIEAQADLPFRRRHLYAASSASAAAERKLQDERRKILEMVQQGKITADEASQLLDALHSQDESTRRQRRKPRWVRIRVTDVNEDKVRVNLTLPVGLVRAGLRAGGSIAGVEGLDTAGLEEMLNRGEIGHLLDVRDEEDGERIEIFVE
ncbi:MAG: SHOCT-like domain-containing protein [Anaerolineae bacterium]